jgi:hypothetical protein
MAMALTARQLDQLACMRCYYGVEAVAQCCISKAMLV